MNNGIQTAHKDDDASVIADVAAGNSERFRVLVERYQGRVFNLVIRLVRDYNQAHDVTQDAFLRAFRSLHTFKKDASFRSWLFKIAQNSAFSWLNKSHRKREIPNAGKGQGSWCGGACDSGAAEAEKRVDRRALMFLLAEVLDELKPVYRAAVLLRHQEEMSLKEIADVLGVPLGTVKSRLNYAYRQIRARLESKGAQAP